MLCELKHLLIQYRLKAIYSLILAAVLGNVRIAIADDFSPSEQSAPADDAARTIRIGDIGAASGAMAPTEFTGFDFNRAFLRGFANESALRNGYRDYGYLGFFDFANIDAVEVLKGPASALYGNGKPGGDLNTITKAPTSSRLFSESTRVDSYGYARQTIDLSGPIGDSSLLYRVNAATAYGTGFRDVSDKRKSFIAPMVTWAPSGVTTFMLDIEAVKAQGTWDPYLVPQATSLMRLPLSRYLGERWNEETDQGLTVRTSMQHRFSTNILLRQAFFIQTDSVHHSVATFDTYGLSSTSVLQPNLIYVNRVSEQLDQSRHFAATQLEIFFNSDWLDTKQLFHLGTEYGRFFYDTQLALAPIDAINSVAPVYGAVPQFPYSPYASQRSGTNSGLFYVIDNVTLSHLLQALLSVRVDHFTTYYSDKLKTSVNTTASQTVWSPRLGIVLTPHPDITISLSLTNSARPQLMGVNARGELFPAETGTQRELSMQIKSDDRRTVSTISLFSIKKLHSLTTDPNNPDYSIATGERRSKGVEFDLSSNLDNLSVSANFAYTKAWVAKDASIPTGEQLAGVAPFFASMYFSYTIPFGRGSWEIGNGLLFESRREITVPSSGDTLPSNFRMDASVAYQTAKWRLELSGRNVLNRKVYESDGFTISPEEPRTLQLQLTRRPMR